MTGRSSLAISVMIVGGFGYGLFFAVITWATAFEEGRPWDALIPAIPAAVMFAVGVYGLRCQREEETALDRWYQEQDRIRQLIGRHRAEQMEEEWKIQQNQQPPNPPHTQQP